MNTKLILGVLGLLFILTPCGALENPNVGSPFQPSNAPTQSGQRQRFISGSNSYGTIGNDIVSGNVSGMKYFRGVVPYGSSYYTGGYTGNSDSRSVSNFLRRSADPIVNDRNPGQPASYFEPRRMASSYRLPDGTSGLSVPQQMTGQGRSNPYVTPPLDPMINTQYQQRPLSSNNMDLDQILARREELRQKANIDTELSDEENSEEKSFLDQFLISEEDEKQDSENPEEKTEADLNPEQNLLAEFQKQDTEAVNASDEEEANDEGAQTDELMVKDYASPKSDLLPEIDPEMLRSEEGKKILGEHETFASLAEEKFTTFMNVAEDFIKQKQFYKAADTYALAIVWKPKDARGYLGQSFSLFGAGEYMSSAYYLSRAMELDSKVALKKFDLSAFIGNRDVFENRVLELTTWQQRSGSGELALLLAYVSYQDGKAVRAKDAINTAKNAMPDNRAVMILKNIIDPAEILK